MKNFLALATLLVLFVTAAQAHFQLQFPPPRGPFVESSEPTFCDGYTKSVSNRSEFPLSTGGFYSLNSEHPQWTVAVFLTTVENPTSFQNFSQVTPFTQLNGEGIFCLPLNFAQTNATGLSDGTNATIQVVFSGGDGNLFQCADLTLSSSFNISSSVSCTNATGSSSTAGTSKPASPSSTAPPKTGGAIDNSVPAIIAVLALAMAGLAWV